MSGRRRGRTRAGPGSSGSPGAGARLESPFRHVLVLLGALLWAGCGAASDEAGSREQEAGSGVTSSLLENPPEPLPQEGQAVNVSEMGHDEGPRDARVYVVEFSDFGCGYCRKFHMETWPVLREEFVGVEKVGWKLIPFVSGMFRNSRRATVTAECAADQGRFPDMARTLFREQPEWKPADDPDPLFRGYARELGLDMEAFDACVAGDEAGERVTRATRVADRLGVRGTPTFFVDGYPVQGALPVELFREVFQVRLGEKEPPRR